MTKGLLKTLLHRYRTAPRQDRSAGFTLLELLIVAFIAGGLISGLMFVAIQLLTADQRESSQTETQREMQLAMDYISSELREAVYIYTGSCLNGDGGSDGICDGLGPRLPATLTQTGNVPVLAFWKPQTIPDGLRQQCANFTPTTNTPNLVIRNTTPPVLVPCLTGTSYSLIVYSLDTRNPSNIWRGRARITRYQLSQFEQDPTATGPNARNTFRQTPGYVNPAAFRGGNNFQNWPFDTTASPVQNAQGSNRPTGTPQVLVDFVDNTATDNSLPPTDYCASDTTVTASANAPYEITPSNAALTSAGLAGVRSFYACVSRATGVTVTGTGASTRATDSNSAAFRDTILFLRGNAFGRPGVNSNTAFLPTLETRVLARTVLQRANTNTN